MFNFIKRYIKRNYGIDKEYFRFIDDMFGFIPNNIELYKVALIHKSASQSIGGHHINNERLEYLGDAVIESITSDYLFIAYPDQDEGFLTQMRSKLVSRQSLNEMAVFIGLDKYLICKSGVTLQQKHIYGDAFEAMMGAIYLDKGYEFTNRLLINDIYEKFLSIDELSYSESDFKSRLIEWCQKNRHTLEFRTTKGFDKKNSTQVFYTKVLIDGIETGHGIGDSKKSSEQSAACSVTREMSDEECAKLLDRIDRLMGVDDAKQQPQKAAKQKARKEEEPKPASPAEPSADGEQSGEESVEQQAGDHKRRRNRRKKHGEAAAEQSANAAAEAESEVTAEPAAESTAEVETPSVSEEPAAEEQPAKKHRRGRRKKSEQTAGEPQSGEAEGAAEAQPEEQEQPAKRRRGRKKSAGTAEGTTDSAAEAAEPTGDEQQAPKRRGRRKKSETADEAQQPAVESETTPEGEQPAKRRRGRRKKSETAGGEAPEAAAEAPAAEVQAPAAPSQTADNQE